MAESLGDEAPHATQTAWHLGALLCMLVLTAVTFGKSAFFGYLPWDDYENITQNPNLTGAATAGLLKIWSSPYDGLYIPLTYTTWWAEKVARLGPHTSHLINLILHAVNSWGVYLVALLVLGRYSANRKSYAAALVAAAIWCVHPVQTEAVAWATGRKDLLAGFFGVFATVCYLTFLSQRRAGWYWTSVLLFACSLLSKASAVPLPLALLLLDWPKQRKDLPRVGARLAPYLALSLCAVLLNSAAHRAVEQGNSARLPLKMRPLLVGDSVNHYVRMLVWPRNLSPVYERTLANIGYTPAALIAVLGAILLLIICARRRTPAWCGAVVAIAFLLPVSGVVLLHYQTISTTADRYMYLPMAPVAVTLAILLQHLARLDKYIAAITSTVALVLVAALCCLSSRQTVYWRDSLSLWSHAVQAAPRSAVAHSNLGMSFGEAGKPEEAFQEFQIAAELDPDYGFAQMNLATAYLQRGDTANAQSHYEAAVRSNSQLLDAQTSLARIYFQSQRLDEASMAARAVLAQRPADFTALVVLASVLGTQGHPDQALKLVRDAAVANPADQQIQQLLRQAESIAKGGS